MKRPGWIALVLTIVVLAVLGWLWIFGFTKRSLEHGTVTRLQYFENPAMLAVHVESPPRVFVIPATSEGHAERVRQFVDPAAIELEQVTINAGNIHDQWSDLTERHDSLGFGVVGKPRGSSVPNLDGKMSIGFSEENYPYKTLKWMTPEEFAKLPVGKPFTDVKVGGKAGFVDFYRIAFRDKPKRQF